MRALPRHRPRGSRPAGRVPHRETSRPATSPGSRRRARSSGARGGRGRPTAARTHRQSQRRRAAGPPRAGASSSSRPRTRSPATAARRQRRPEVPRECEHNGHLYRLLLASAKAREETLAELGRAGIHAVFHYVPLHDSPAGLRYGRASGNLRVTEDAAARLIRLPLHASLTEAEQARVIEAVYSACRQPEACL